MHEVRLHFVEQTLIVGDQHDANFGSVLAHFTNALGDNSQRINVETRICFVKNRQLGFENRHLHNFVALFFATRKTFIEISVHER